MLNEKVIVSLTTIPYLKPVCRTWFPPGFNFNCKQTEGGNNSEIDSSHDDNKSLLIAKLDFENWTKEENWNGPFQRTAMVGLGLGLFEVVALI